MDAAERIDTWVAQRRNELLGFAARLLQIPSESRPPAGHEAECQEFIAAALRRSGAEVDVFTPDDVPELQTHPLYLPTWDGMPRTFAGRPNVVGVFRGSGGGRSILFSTHVDTVPYETGKWVESTPFSGELKDGKLYGRGAYDIKSATAAALFAARCVTELGLPRRGDVIVESVVDEEFGGSHGCLASRLRGYQADIAINSEPTNMAVCPIHRGGGEWKIVVRGDPGMAFNQEKLDNPVYKLARVIDALRAWNDWRNREVKAPPAYAADPFLPIYITQVGGGGDTYQEQLGIPAECYLYVWAEEHCGTDREEHERSLIDFVNRYLAEQPDFDGVYPEYRRTIRYMEGSEMNPNHAVFQVLRRAYDSSGRTYEVQGAPFACDAYVFNSYSLTPAVVIGPGGGNAHGPDEFCLVEDLVDLARIYARTIAEWCE